MLRRVVFCAPVLAALVACGAGGGSSIPSTPVSSPTTAPTSATVQFTVGQGQAIQIARRPQYVSPHTLSLVVTYNSTRYDVNFIQGTPGCSGAIPNLVCTVQFTAAIGSDTFGIAAYDAYNGAGQLLSKAQITVNVAAGTNNVRAVLDGVAVSAKVQTPINVPEAIPTSVPFTVTAYDADGAAIVGPGNFTTPIPLSDSDTGGGTTVSASASGPSTQPVLTYNGTSPVSYGASISASVNGISNSASGLIRIVPQYAQYNTPSGNSTAGIAGASDGSMWVMEAGNGFSSVPMTLAHVAANGSATETRFTSYFGAAVGAMTVGPDGALWCTLGQSNGARAEIARIDAAGNITTYGTAPLSAPASIVVGPDKRLWFPQGSGVAAMDTSGGYTFYSYPTAPNGMGTAFGAMTVGPDGNLWAAETGVGGVLRITPAGVMTYFQMPLMFPGSFYYAQPNGIAAQGSYIDVTSGNTIYQFDTSGNLLKTYAMPNFTFGGIAPASNGAVWVPIGVDTAGGSVIGRLSASGVFSTVSVPFANDPGIGAPSISHLASAADGSMWYVRDVAYGRIVVH